MTPSEFTRALEVMRWTQRDLARELRCTHGLVSLWAGGILDIPTPVAVWVTSFVAYRMRHPPPDWRVQALHQKPDHDALNVAHE